jgi:DMSO/TMAO reductase YedYZ molybdopterin-dependent catalytic subunit
VEASAAPPTGIERRAFRARFWRGVLAMGSALLIVYTAQTLFPLVSFPPVRVADLLIKAAPGRVATFFIEALGKGAIRTLAIGVNLGALAAGGALGIFIGKAQGAAPKARRALAVALAVFGVSMLLGIGTPGAGSLTAALAYAAGALLFAKIAAEVPLLSAIEPKKVEGDETPLDAVLRSRRSFIVRTGLLVAALVGGGGIWRVLRSRNSQIPIAAAARPFVPPAADSEFPSIAGLAPEITPNEDFYNIDINIIKPAVEHSGWRLKVSGLVDDPYELTYEQLQEEFEVVEMASTLTCISNEVGGHLISTAVWRGVRLREVLERARLRSGIVDIVFRGAEGYSDSIPAGKAMEDTTLVVFGMNGVALPRDHGFPARIIVPGIYGMKNVKWLTGIEPVGTDYQGYWMVRGWSDTARVKTSSRFDTPQDGASVDAGTMLAGVAWAGDRGIRRVEISQDDGATWVPGVMKRELGPLTWRLWASELKQDRGEVRVLVRAVDGAGETQSASSVEPHPDGASGYHFLDLNVT